MKALLGIKQLDFLALCYVLNAFIFCLESSWKNPSLGRQL